MGTAPISDEALTETLLRAVDDGGADTGALAAAHDWDHGRVVGLMKSLESFGLIVSSVRCPRAPSSSSLRAALFL